MSAPRRKVVAGTGNVPGAEAALLISGAHGNIWLTGQDSTQLQHRAFAPDIHCCSSRPRGVTWAEAARDAIAAPRRQGEARLIYLDHNSTTPMDLRVIDAMSMAMVNLFGNPSSAHAVGSKAMQAVERAREQVGALVGADGTAVTFYSSATEAINAVVRSSQGKVITSIADHAATLRSVDRLEQSGIEVTRLAVDIDGQPDMAQLREALASGDVALVTTMWANNETGVIYPIEELAQICSDFGVPLHVDAVQAAGKIPLSLQHVPIDFLTLSAHKMQGPKGIGALVCALGRIPAPMIVGGGQERGIRAGTENVAGIVGFGIAAEIALQELAQRHAQLSTLRDAFEQAALAKIPGTWVNGMGSERLPNTSSMGFAGISGDDLAAQLDLRGICVSTGSACHAAASEPSHVILAMTGSREMALSTVRFSVGPINTAEDIETTLQALDTSLAVLR